MKKPITIKQFFQRFPDDDACLEHLMAMRYGRYGTCPNCKRDTKYHRISKRKAYECQYCGHHIYPMAGTPFERSRTSLQLWYYAMFLFCATRNGVSAKELQRQLGVTYKTAWRMGHEIRKYMAWVDGEGPLGGKPIVEVDKSYMGGRDKKGKSDKSIVLGIAERDGELVARVVEGKHQHHVMPHIYEVVLPNTRVASDKSKSFASLNEDGYRHGTTNHSKGEYVRGPIHVNNLEGFFSWLKRGINGTHVWVSSKHLENYVKEFEFRYNLRDLPEIMFDLLISAFPRPQTPLTLEVVEGDQGQPEDQSAAG